MPQATVVEAAEIESAKSREEQARSVVGKGMLLSMGGGLIPMPVLDLAGIGSAQTYMLCRLSDLYAIPYTKHTVRNVIATLMSSVGLPYLATGAVASLLKSIPGLGTIGGALSLPIVAGASAYALGKVFIKHFECGGTLLDFDPKSTRRYFAEQFAEGKTVAAELKQKERDKQ